MELTVVFSSLLPKKIPTSGHHVYNPKKSPTAKVMTGSKWNISYGDGSYASGVVYTVSSADSCDLIFRIR